MKPKNKIEPWLYVLPALIVYMLIVVIPVLWSLIYSCFSWKGVGAMKFIGLGNYERLLKDKVLITTIKNNLIFVVGTCAYQLFFGLALALLVTNIKRGSNVFRVIFYTPCILSTVAMCKIYEKMLSVYPQGIFAAVMELLGLPQVALLSDPDIALYVVIFLDGYKNVGIYMVIFYNALTNISIDVMEAAYLDGCSTFKMIRYIKLPLVVPVIFTSLVLLVNGALKSFSVAYILTNGGPGYSTEMVATYMYKTAFSASNFGYASAIGTFLLVESLICVTLLRKLSNRVETYA